MKPRFVQIQNPVSKEWVRIDTREGRIVGHRRKPYAVPVARPRDRRLNPHTERDSRGRYCKTEGNDEPQSANA
jgi:hypothetical protein